MKKMRDVTLTKRSFALFAALALVVGCHKREQPVSSKPGETKKTDDTPSTGKGGDMTKEVKGKYADINGLKMYYEIHGTGKPLVALHGAFGKANVHPALAKGRQVIAVELQGHGHTGDIDRPLTYTQMADDVAALLRHLEVKKADVFGYSMGGNVALAFAIRHPDLTGKVVINGSHFGKLKDAYEPATFAQFESLPADFAPAMLKGPYDEIAPDPKQWPVVVAKVKKLGLTFEGFTREDMKAIKSPVLIALGDRDGVRPEHAVEMFRLIPNAQLALFPGADHFLIFQHPEKLFATVVAFLDAPTPG